MTVTIPEGYREVRFKTVQEFINATIGKEVYETPDGFADVIGGIRIFDVRGFDGNLIDEYCVFVKDK